MDIHGLQKLTLLDFPGRVACTVFLQGCDLRCPFCHNGGLVLGGMEPVTDDAGLLDFLKKRRGLLDGVAITGGEPLLRRELPALLRSIKELGYAVKLDTNGSHPEALRAVVATGLVDYVAMDIKNSPAKYAATVGLPGFDLTPVRQSAALLLEGTVDYEFRTTVCAPLHTPRDMEELGRWLKGARRYFLQPFADSGALVGSGVSPPSEDEIKALRDSVLPYIPNTQIRGQ